MEIEYLWKFIKNSVMPWFCEAKCKDKIKWQDRIMTKPNIRSCHLDHLRQKSGNKNFDDNVKLL